MKGILAAFSWILLAIGNALPMAEATYTQKYVIFIRGVPSGIETVNEELDQKDLIAATTVSEINLNDGFEIKRLAFNARLVIEKKSLTPVSYTYEYTSGQAGDRCQVTVRNGEIRRILNRGGRTSEAVVPLKPNVILLDFNVYHQYDYLLRKYDRKAGGRQSFQNFIPLIAGEIPLALTRLEDSNLEHPNGNLPVQNYKIEYGGIGTGTISADSEGRLVRLVAPEQDLEVVRQDLIDESLLKSLLEGPKPDTAIPPR